MKLTIFAVATSIAILTSLSANANTLLCVEDVAGGIKFMDGAWTGVKFKTGESQFMVSSPQNDPQNYTVKKIGDDNILFNCTRFKFVGDVLSDQMVCGGLGYGMVINFKHLRYVEVYTLGYIDDDRSGHNTPSVTGGKCSTISP